MWKSEEPVEEEISTTSFPDKPWTVKTVEVEVVLAERFLKIKSLQEPAVELLTSKTPTVLRAIAASTLPWSAAVLFENPKLKPLPTDARLLLESK